jgi:protein-S-isoprenylcysteine O-methyltransferase Ste14
MSPVQALQLLTLPWIASEILVFRRDLQAGKGERRDLGSRLGIFLGIGLGLSLTFRFAALHVLALPGSPWGWFIGGALLGLAGILIRQRAVAQLGSYFRTRVTLLDDHRLITDGLYARLRHPAYSGAWLTCFGIGIASASLAGIIVMIVLPGLALAWRMRVEERALAERFGADWQSHRARTAAIIPGLW